MRTTLILLMIAAAALSAASPATAYKTMIPAGKSAIVHISNGSVSDTQLPEEPLDATTLEAVKRAPAWLYWELIRNLSLLQPDLRIKCAELILNAQDPYIDEIAFCVAHLAPEDLSRMDLSLIQKNAMLIYETAGQLKYVKIIDHGIAGIDRDYYSTTSYRVGNGKKICVNELPRDIYYWYIVHPKITRELPDYIDPATGEHGEPGAGVFWRDYLYNHNDPGRLLLKNILSTCEVLWCGKKNDPDNGAIGAISQWLKENIKFCTPPKRQFQPVRVYNFHEGRCSECGYLNTAAARTALIPCLLSTAYADNHKWNEFYDRRWIQWEPIGMMMDAPGTYDKWKDFPVTGVFNWRGDGYVWNSTDHYSAACKLRVRLTDLSGNPIDGAQVIVDNPGGYPKERCLWSYTDNKGECSLNLGDELQTFEARIRSGIGLIDGKFKINRSITAEVYTWSPVYYGQIRKPAAVPFELKCPDGMQLDFSVTVESELLQGQNPDDNSTFCLTQAGKIDLYLCDAENYARYLSGMQFSAALVLKNVSSLHSSVKIPAEGNWYLIFSNEGKVNAAECIKAKVECSFL
ncbi:MAG: transglutaminase-like domain-containing protein [Candidatus Wallbacteria bacterium]|nr:transglutaminase-like domain-containing protein [Candidatus Wallbacteria bacterium]